MILYYPAKSYTPFSIRGGSDSGGTGFEYATQWSFSLKEAVTLFIPYSRGFGGQTYFGDMPFTDYPNYLGIIVISLAFIGFCKSNLSKNYKVFFLQSERYR